MLAKILTTSSIEYGEKVFIDTIHTDEVATTSQNVSLSLDTPQELAGITLGLGIMLAPIALSILLERGKRNRNARISATIESDE